MTSAHPCPTVLGKRDPDRQVAQPLLLNFKARSVPTCPWGAQPCELVLEVRLPRGPGLYLTTPHPTRCKLNKVASRKGWRRNTTSTQETSAQEPTDKNFLATVT